MRLEESISSGESSKKTASQTEEDRILETIVKLRAELDRIVSTTGPSKRSLSIHGEIKRLLDQIASYRAQARERIAEFSQGNVD